MALNPKDLADRINKAINATDGNGLPISTTPQMLAYATAIISTLQAAAVFHPPGTVTGSVSAMQANNGTFLPPLNPQVWTGILSAAIPGPNVQQEALASTGYIMSSANIVFGVGDITGVSTATPVSSGALVAGAGTGGKLTELTGSDWALLISAPVLGDPSLTKDIYTAIVEYLTENIEIIYAPGSVNGTFPIAGAPLVAGTGTGGLIT